MKKLIKKILREGDFELINDEIKIYILKLTDYDGKYENDIGTKYFGDYDKAIKYLVDNGYEKDSWPVFDDEYESWGKDYSLLAKLYTKTLEQ